MCLKELKGTKMAKDRSTHQIISVLMKSARHSINCQHYEDAVIKLQQCLQLKDESRGRAAILDELGYCFLKLGWFEDAVEVYTEYLKILPSDNDGRFFLASAYASLRWTDEAIEELRTILTSDPNDVLARHDLALCYRDMGWMKESLEEMKRANACAMIYGNSEEKEIVKSSLANIEKESENGDDEEAKDAFLLFILLTMINKRRNPKTWKPPKDRR
jgi:tetratricopeptide (TPR) repeat protein